MKNYFLLCFMTLAISLVSKQMTGQDYLGLFEQMNYTELASALSNDVTLKINNQDKITGKKKVLAAIKSQLNNFIPTQLETNHRGSTDEDERNYLIGKLFNANEEGIRIFVNLERAGNGRQICDIKLRAI